VSSRLQLAAAFFAAIACAGALPSGCRGPSKFDTAPAHEDVQAGSEQLYAARFAKGLQICRLALALGLDLLEREETLPIPITNASLYARYPKASFLPTVLDPLIEDAAAPYLDKIAAGAEDEDEARLATICREIIRSPQKVRREGGGIGAHGVSFDLVLYHYHSTSDFCPDSGVTPESLKALTEDQPAEIESSRDVDAPEQGGAGE